MSGKLSGSGDGRHDGVLCCIYGAVSLEVNSIEESVCLAHTHIHTHTLTNIITLNKRNTSLFEGVCQHTYGLC